MKTIMQYWPLWLFITTILALFAGVGSATACGEGCEMVGAACACDLKPAEVAPAVRPSDEKPPRSGRAALEGDMPQSLIYKDSKADQEKLDADHAGKVAAGLE